MIDKQQEIFEVDCLMVDRSAIRCDRVPSLLLNFFPYAQHSARCLKITEKVSFNIASEASYVYIGPFWQVFENLKLLVKQCYQTFLIGQKLTENAKIQIFKCVNLSNFQTIRKMSQF